MMITIPLEWKCMWLGEEKAHIVGLSSLILTHQFFQLWLYPTVAYSHTCRLSPTILLPVFTVNYSGIAACVINGRLHCRYTISRLTGKSWVCTEMAAVPRVALTFTFPRSASFCPASGRFCLIGFCVVAFAYSERPVTLVQWQRLHKQSKHLSAFPSAGQYFLPRRVPVL